jgi:hypothetical protein
MRDAKSVWKTHNYLKLGIFHLSPFSLQFFLLFLCLVFFSIIIPSHLYLPMLHVSTCFASTPPSALDSWYVGWRTRFLYCLTSTKDNRIIDSATFQRTRSLGCRHQLLPTWCNPEENTQHLGLTSVGTRYVYINVTLSGVREVIVTVESKKYYTCWVCVCSLRYRSRKAHAL